ncbi:MAG: hypothetical protein ACHQ4H_11110 [Ktedonobacterales bacterium]
MQVVEQVTTVKQPRTRTVRPDIQRVLRWARHPLFWVELAVGLYILLVSITEMTGPLDRDEGAFLTIARVVLHGGLPYRDAFDQKSPAIYYLLAGLLAVTAWLTPLHQILVIRALVVLTNVATAAGLVLLGKRWWRLEVGVLAAAFWLLCMPLFQGDHFFTEPFAIVTTVFALVAVAYRPTARGALVAGLLLALGSLFKQTTVLAVPGVLLVLLEGGRGWRNVVRVDRSALVRVAAFVAGLAVPWVVVFAAFAAAGVFGAMWQQVVVSNITHYPADGTLRDRLLLGPKRFPLVFVAPALLAAAGMLRWAGWWPGGRRAPSAASVALLLIMALASFPFLTHSYPHYWLQLLPSATLLTAVAAYAMLDAWRPRSALEPPAGWHTRALAPLLLLSFLLLATWSTPPTTHLKLAEEGLRAQVNAGQLIAQNTTPGERIVVMPAEAEYYYLSDRMPATSTIYVQAINITPQLVNQIIADITAQRYGAVVWRLGPFNDWTQNIAIYQDLSAHYHLVASDPPLGLQIWLPGGAA